MLCFACRRRRLGACCAPPCRWRWTTSGRRSATCVRAWWRAVRVGEGCRERGLRRGSGPRDVGRAAGCGGWAPGLPDGDHATLLRELSHPRAGACRRHVAGACRPPRAGPPRHRTRSVREAKPSLAVAACRIAGAARALAGLRTLGPGSSDPPTVRRFPGRGPVLDDGGRSRLPLRGSPGFPPGSLLPLRRRDGGEPVAEPTLRQSAPSACATACRVRAPRRTGSEGSIGPGRDVLRRRHRPVGRSGGSPAGSPFRN